MQLIYFPYLMLGNLEEITYDNVRVWNFRKKADEYIQNEALKQKIKALLATNKYEAQPIQDMGILSIGEIDFRHATEEEIDTANEIKLMLFLTCLARNYVRVQGAKAGHYIATSENFLFVVQNFLLESDYISESAGYIVHKTVGGYKMNERSFIAPVHVLKPFVFGFNSDLRETLLKLKSEYSNLYARILRATDLFFQSYYNNTDVSLNARILLQVGALEVLLDLPNDGQQRRRLKEAVEKLTSLPNDPIETYQFEKGNTLKSETKSIKVKWADRFYTMP